MSLRVTTSKTTATNNGGGRGRTLSSNDTAKAVVPIVTVRIYRTTPTPTSVTGTGSSSSSFEREYQQRHQQPPPLLLQQFQVIVGGCVWIQGPSGHGKTTMAMQLVPSAQLGVTNSNVMGYNNSNNNNNNHHNQMKTVLQQQLQLDVHCEWHSHPTQSQPPPPPHAVSGGVPNVGIVFQQTTLLDELTVAGNLALAIIQCCQNGRNSTITTTTTMIRQMKDVLEMVGLDYSTTIQKRCTELSGGMARRVALAVQLILLPHRTMMVLDEPFTGLDPTTARSIANVVRSWRRAPHYVAIVLITHDPELAHIVFNNDDDDDTDDVHTKNKNDCDGTETSAAATFTAPKKNIGNVIVSLPEPSYHQQHGAHHHHSSSSQQQQHDELLKPPPMINTVGITMYDRFRSKLYDYIVYSIPLILLTFFATGTAIAMVTADSIQRFNIHEPVMHLIDTEVPALLQLLTGADNKSNSNEPKTINPFYMMGIKFKINHLLQTTVPVVKSNIYCIGMVQLFTLEIGPLLTGLLLSGRIGGSYAGNIATMITTRQLPLLQTMGISTNIWLFYPTILAAWIAVPVLTMVGTSIALLAASYIGSQYYNNNHNTDDTMVVVSSIYDFWKQVHKTILPPLRLQGLQSVPDDSATSSIVVPKQWNGLGLDYFRTTYSPHLYDSMIEILTYPILFAMIKSFVFSTIIICTAELCTNYHQYHHQHYWYGLYRKLYWSRRRPEPNGGAMTHRTLTHRDVPHIITTSIVTSSLCIIIADWGFSRLWLQRH